jgi:alkylresorcinol/alkylpyrone synthase
MVSTNGRVRAPARLLAVATAVPPHPIEQEVAGERALALFGGRMSGYERLAGVFASNGIARRYSVRPIEWFSGAHGWPDRTEAYLTGACDLYRTVVERALREARLTASDIDAVVTVSSTGIATPSLEARLLPELGFGPATRRVPVFGLGCAGGVSGLALAAELAKARPGANVLMVTVELCTLAFRLDHPTKSDIIAASLFGDGAAAVVVTSRTEGDAIGTITGSTEHLWPRSLDIMGWRIDDTGFGVVLSRSLPDFIATHYAPVFAEACERLEFAQPPGRAVCHPGGRRVLEAIESMLGVAPESLEYERAVMRDFGNMSAPTVFFVLQRAIAAGLPPKVLLAALGPGFTASFVALDTRG